MLTDRDIDVLKGIARYYVLSRTQISRLYFPTDRTGRSARTRLQKLYAQKLIGRQNQMFCTPASGTPAAVYYPTPKGCAFIAEHLEDSRYLATCTEAPIHVHIPHWLACSETHIALDQAVDDQVQVVNWISEFDIVNHDEDKPHLRYKLYTQISESPKVVCAPDAAFMLSKNNQTAMYYLEQDRATSGVKRVAASKTKGYAELANRNLYQKHFKPTVSGFRVLMVTPHPARRENLRKAIDGKPGCDLWRFAATEDVTPEKILYEPIWHTCKGDVLALVKK